MNDQTTLSDINAGTFIVTNATITVGTTSITYITKD
jgi:hypothetical protein